MATWETDEYQFRRIDEDFIFIASSRDVAEERSLVHLAIQDELVDLGEDGNVKVYSFDTALQDVAIDQNVSMQRNIPRPSVKNCRGIIYVLGERLGLPLETGLPKERLKECLGESQSWLQVKEFPLKLDWPMDPDKRRKLLSAGAFPLTGGVFEYLAALGAGTPVWFILLAEKEVNSGGGQIVLNGNRWRQEQTRDKNLDQSRRWESEEYEPDIEGVHNFLRAFVREGLSQNPTSDLDKLLRDVRGFVRKNIFDHEVSVQNPYRELQFYDVNHGEFFYGRDDYASLVVNTLRSKFEKSKSKAACCIYGPSGSGKSSVLRAGILRYLRHPDQRGKYFCSTLRPDMFRDGSGGDLEVISTVLDVLENDGAPAIPITIRRDISRAGASAPVNAAKAILKEIRAQPVPPEYIVISLDQFEEIVDECSSPERAEYWFPLMRLIETLAKDPSFGLLFTLESGRMDKVKDRQFPAIIRSAHFEELSDATGTFIDQIIKRPFGRTGYPLDQTVIDELRSEFDELREQELRSARNSVLPLLSLKLHDLWDHVAAHFEHRDGVEGKSPDMIPSDRKISIEQLKSSKWIPSFDTVLNDLALKAWRRAGQGRATVEKIGFFLQPLVGVRGNELQLMASPREAPYRAEAEVIASFRAHRLLIDVGDGLVRLVHQAVLDHWDVARNWLGKSRSFLQREAEMRIKAHNWAVSGRKITSRGKRLAKEIGAAVEILSEYRRAWSIDPTKVQGDDITLRDFCCALLGRSMTPRKFCSFEPRKTGSHVGLAASYDLTEQLEKFLCKDPSLVGQISPSQFAPLAGAAWSSFRSVRFLLSHGADPFLVVDNWPSICCPIQVDRYDIFKVIMAEAAKRVSGKPLEALFSLPNERTLVHHAARYNFLDVLKELIERHGFAIAPRDDGGRTPLHFSCMYDALESFNYLRKYAGLKDIDNSDNNCLHYAAAYGSKKCLDQILRLPEGLSLVRSSDNRGYSALLLAAERSQAECLATLLNVESDIDSDITMALHLLLQRIPGARFDVGDHVLAETPMFANVEGILLDCGGHSQPFDLGRFAEYLERSNLSTKQVEHVLSSVRDSLLHPDGYLKLDQAVESLTERSGVADDNYDQDRALKTLKILLDAPGVDVNARDKFGRTPLGIVGDVKPFAKLLLEHPTIDLSKPVQKKGRPGIYLAARTGAWDAVRNYLDQYGLPKGTKPDADGNTFLHVLTAESAPHDLLLERISEASKAQLNARNKRGRTPLHRAIAARDWPVVDRILDTSLVELHKGKSFTNWELHLVLSAALIDKDMPKTVIPKIIDALGPRKMAVKDADGWSLLHYYASAGADNLIEIWSEHADLKTMWVKRDKSGQRPIDLAQSETLGLAPDLPRAPVERSPIRWDSGLNWKPVSESRLATALGHLGLAKADQRGLVAEQTALPFYPKKSIVRLTYKKNGRTRPTYYFLASGRNLSRLDGTSPPIHSFNAKHLTLEEEHALRYLHFFGFFVRGEDGPFFIWEAPGMVNLSGELREEDITRVSEIARPTIYRGWDKDSFRFVARVFYSNAVFAAYFKVFPTGHIEMEDDQPLLADLSVHVDSPLH